MEDHSEWLRERILSLSLRWCELRDVADFLEYSGRNASEVKAAMAELQEEIRRLKDEMGTEEPIRTPG